MATIEGMQSFVYDQPATRVIFGVGTLERLAEEVKRLGAKRALVLATPEQRKDAEAASQRLGEMSAGVYAEAVMHVPIETARKAREEAARLDADCYVAVGGGSTVGLGKAIALESGLPILAVPTTYAGSEMTPIYGITEAGVKKTGKDRKVLPKTVIYDVNLTLSLPAKIAGPSGMNAMAHLVEGLYAQDANPIISLLAVEGIGTWRCRLPLVVKDQQFGGAQWSFIWSVARWNRARRRGNGAESQLVPHPGRLVQSAEPEVHTVILPYATAYNQQAAAQELNRAAEALGAKSAAQGTYDLSVKIGAPVALKDIGMPSRVWIAQLKSRRRILTTIRGRWITRACGNYSKTRITKTARMSVLLPTTLVGSYPQPDWLIDREMLTNQMPPRTRLLKTVACGSGVVGSAGRCRTARHPRTGTGRDRYRDRRRSASRELFEPVCDRPRRHRSG